MTHFKDLNENDYMKIYTFAALILMIPTHTFADYYYLARGKSGNELKSALHIIIDNHRVLPYTTRGNDNWFDKKNMDVWEALVYTDSACDEELTNCGMVQMLYLDEARSITKANRGSGGNDLWDREHVWPTSRGFKNKAQDGYTDIHHIRPADRDLNGKHSNYGYDKGGKAVKDTLSDGTKVETTLRLNRKNQSFEPSDRAKGQIARMLFYMAVRYEIGDDKGNEQMPDLKLKTYNKKVSEPWIGNLCTLLKWNLTFKVSDFERRRNDRVMGIQGNRNPFIDHPEWADSIWGHQC